MRIGIFDSGVGGLTVLKELIKETSNNEYIYIGDTKNMPFGNKTKEQLLTYSCKIIDYLIYRKVDMIVIACGTICSTIYENLCEIYDIKLINIVYETINYINEKNYDNVAVIATTNTINSNIFKNGLMCNNLYLQDCPQLANLVENNSCDKYEYLEDKIKLFKDKIELLVFGCTHYSVFDSYVLSNYGFEVLNMGYPVAKKINNGLKFCLEIYFSKLNENLNEIVKDILNIDVEIKEIDLERVIQ